MKAAGWQPFFIFMHVKTFYTHYFHPGGISTDSRKINRGDIFIALKGDHFDGNQYAVRALEAGARIAVVDDPGIPASDSLYKVDNSLKFLQDLAHFHRHHIRAHILGLTGSNGKTTTKELLNVILGKKYRVQATQGNLNNHIGVPLSLLALKNDTDFAIIEMGANHPGEIKSLCEIAEPDSGLITNIGRAHLEGFGGFEGVKQTKAELYRYVMHKKGKIYYNAKDPVLTDLIKDYPEALPYLAHPGICRGEIISASPTLSMQLTAESGKSVRIDSRLFGEFNFENIMAAASVGLIREVSLADIKIAVENYLPSNMRSQILQNDRVFLILDCYNANPSSMLLALGEFDRLNRQKKYLVLGGMKELGTYSAEEHHRIVEYLGKMNVSKVFLTGMEFRDNHCDKCRYFENAGEIVEELRSADLTGSTILIKGSRANQLETVGDFIIGKYGLQ